MSTNHSSSENKGFVIRPKPVPDAPGPQAAEGPFRHDEAEWNAVYPHIKRMYVVERHKVRHIIDKLEQKHAFRIRPGTLRKRLSQWGFHKNHRLVSRMTDQVINGESRRDVELYMIEPAPALISCGILPDQRLLEPARLPLSSDEAIVLDLLTSIKTWIVAFLEKTENVTKNVVGEKSKNGLQSSINESDSGSFATSQGKMMPRICELGHVYDTDDINFSFRLIAVLLEQEEGVLAGRLVRKVFLQMEGFLSVKEPVLLWNLFEIFWNLMKSQQMQLSQLLSSHLLSLAKLRYSSQHPLLRALRSMQRLIAGFCKGDHSNIEAVRRAWTINANLIFSRPEPSLLLLHYRMIWDSDLITLPRQSLLAANEIYAAMEPNMPSDFSAVSHFEATTTQLHSRSGANYNSEDGCLSTIETLEEYHELMAQSIEDIRELSISEREGTVQKFRALSALLKSKMYEPEVTAYKRKVAHNPMTEATAYTRPCVFIQRMQARTLAYVMRVIMEAENRKEFVLNIAVRRLRNIIDLREYSQDPVGPQILCELSELESWLLRAGHAVEACQVREDFRRRLTRYIEDIPLATAL